MCKLTLFDPIIVVKWCPEIGVMHLINHIIPKSMKIIIRIIAWVKVWECEIVTPCISMLELRIYSCSYMKWLMNITNKMHQKSHGSRVCISLSFCSWLVQLNLLSIIVIWLAIVKPISNSIYCVNDVVWFFFECVTNKFTLIKIRFILKMPIWLPFSIECSFNNICPCSTFGERMRFFSCSYFWIWAFKIL